eukprot:TRINITY_DN62712_c0_g1_i1.p1 TRINITY_DN62712_c0_g1~~TRINITY_DN62712_c0_g1_i1.p1  ORF type:complete len:473 (+),score=106.38 TRINITY_DN62712_c0_g1_i1:52-1470(+)
MTLHKDWSLAYAAFCSVSVALCIVIDILQYSAALSFLPQGLKDRGHSAPEIASVVGSYYWAGFLGGAVITAYQCRRVVCEQPQELRWSHLRCHVLCLIVGLFCGSLTLAAEGFAASYTVHLVCRTLQGFLGAFLFFFSFFLSIELFEANSYQQTLALTLSSMALHTAEVFGPFLGAAIYTQLGPRAPFFVLAVASFFVQALLGMVFMTLPTDDPDDDLAHFRGEWSPIAFSLDGTPKERGWSDLRRLLTHADLWRSVLVIMPAAMVKAALEGVLPLFADHKLRYDEYEVGLCFTLVALSFLSASIALSLIWNHLRAEQQVTLITSSMTLLGVVSCTLLISYMYGGHCNLLIDDMLDPTPDCTYNKKSVYMFYLFLVLFGVSSAGCFTPSAYLIGSVVDSFEDAAMKDAANGVWNTLWEVGGSLGLALAGIPSTRNWRQEEYLMFVLGCVVILAGVAFASVSSLRGASGALKA